MALVDNAASAAQKFTSLSFPRQIGLLVGLALSVAIGVGVVLWSREPSYMPVYSQLSNRDAAEVMNILQRTGVDFKMDEKSGLVLVPADKVQRVRMQLAGEGLPRAAGSVELFSGSNGFGTSQFMENARYKLALEMELARTISQFHDIKSARVHLAIPRESAFVRDTNQPSASVFLDVYSGMRLNKRTIASIVNLVASSIPSLASDRVTVVDQNGQLLSEGGGQNMFSETDKAMDYRNSIEQYYAQKIQDILTPFLGFGRVNAKVSADIDFTSFEQTQEMYNPDGKAIRSEQTLSDKRSVGEQASGVPGALANRAPNSPQPQNKNQGNANAQGANATENVESQDIHSEHTRNYELDKTISHTRNHPGSLKRLTVAVLVDNKHMMNPQTKKMEIKQLSKQELEKVKTLVSDAIGFNAERGDSLNVVNTDFVSPEPVEAMPETSFWKQNWFWSVIKQTLGGLFVLGLVFGVLRPFFNTLASGRNEQDSEQKALSHNNGLPEGADAYETQMHLLRQIVSQEPKKVAQVVKTWVDRG